VQVHKVRTERSETTPLSNGTASPSHGAVVVTHTHGNLGGTHDEEQIQ